MGESDRSDSDIEVDGWDSDSRVGWSVVLKGVAQEVPTGIDRFSAAAARAQRFPASAGGARALDRDLPIRD